MNSKQEQPPSSGDNPLSGWIVFAILCGLALWFDVPEGVLFAAAVGYALSYRN